MDSLEYIDGYFNGEFPPEEAGQFERKIQEDPIFAEEVAYYLSAHIAFKETYIEERKRRFRELYGEHAAAPAMIRHMVRRRMVVALSAAVFITIIALSWLLFIRPVSQPKLADQYIRENLALLSVKMGTGDSLQTGIQLYNGKKFPEALQQFEDILRRDSSNGTAMLDAGIVALRMEDYDRALDYFKKLQVRTDPHINPALFYEALTLMKRHHAGDAALAKQLLLKISKENLDRRADAEMLLRKM